MPITTGAIRKQRADKRKARVNLRIKKSLREAVLAVRKKPTDKNLQNLYRTADRAAKKKVIHSNKAARIKSRSSSLIVNKKKSS